MKSIKKAILNDKNLCFSFRCKIKRCRRITDLYNTCDLYTVLLYLFRKGQKSSISEFKEMTTHLLLRLKEIDNTLFWFPLYGKNYKFIDIKYHTIIDIKPEKYNKLLRQIFSKRFIMIYIKDLMKQELI